MTEILEPPPQGVKSSAWVGPAPELAGCLKRWFTEAHRDLPWRRKRTPYGTWISEVMLQQTQVSRVVPYFERFMCALPGVAALAAAPLDQVLKLWEGLGYYARARHLVAAGKAMMARHGGEVPEDLKALLALPGFGPYTSRAVLSLAFDRPVALLDGNVRRVLARMAAIERPLGPDADRELMVLAETLLPVEGPGQHNEALMELGALVCRQRRPSCSVCPWEPWCLARARGLEERLPRRRPRRARPHFQVTAALIRDAKGRFLITRRPTEGLLGGLWEFPGGKQEEGEELEACIAREIREELGVDIVVEGPFVTIGHAYTHFSIHLHTYWARIRAGTPHPLGCTAFAWVLPERLRNYAISGADQKIILALEAAQGGVDLGT